MKERESGIPKLKRIFFCAVLPAVFILLLAGRVLYAAQEETEEQKKYQIYFIDNSETNLGSEKYEPEKESVDYILQYLIDNYNTGHREGAARYLPNDITIETWSLEENTLTLNLSENYRELGISQEILTRAAMVKTFTQFPEILFVVCTVDGEEITDARGEPIGKMSADTFVEVNSLDKDAYRYDTFTLYFADKDGKKLIPETRRVYYRRSIPKARVALEQLANGPMEKGNYPSISSSSTLLGVVLADGICYADFARNFTEQLPEGITPEMAVWSVAHTLIANTNVSKVEIMIDGKSEASFGELDLYQFFSWNEELSPKPD